MIEQDGVRSARFKDFILQQPQAGNRFRYRNGPAATYRLQVADVAVATWPMLAHGFKRPAS
jgi:hypothetical protein